MEPKGDHPGSLGPFPGGVRWERRSSHLQGSEWGDQTLGRRLLTSGGDQARVLAWLPVFSHAAGRPHPSLLRALPSAFPIPEGPSLPQEGWLRDWMLTAGALTAAGLCPAAFLSGVPGPALLRMVSGSPWGQEACPSIGGSWEQGLHLPHQTGSSKRQGPSLPPRLGTLRGQEMLNQTGAPLSPLLRTRYLDVGRRDAQSWAPGKPGEKVGCWRSCCHSGGGQRRGNFPPRQEGRTKNLNPSVRSFPHASLSPGAG